MVVQQQQVAPRSAGGATLADVLERVLDKGIVIAGDVKLFLADVEVLTLQIRLVVCSVDKAREVGLDWWTNHPAFGGRRESSEASAKKVAGQEPLARIEQRLGQLEDMLKKANMPAGKQ
jgi:hypothetical protein